MTAAFQLTRSERMAIVSLLDELCAHEECVIECHTTVDGEPARDKISVLAVNRSRRIWRRAQNLMVKLKGPAEVRT